MEIVTQDHPGLLYEIGSALARLGLQHRGRAD